MSEENKRLVRELTEVIWNSRGLDRIPEFYAPDFVGNYRPYTLRQGHQGVSAMVEGAWTAFPDYHEEVHDLIAEGDRVVVHLTISGTQRGQWGRLPPTGKRAEFDEIVILQIRDGKVVRQRGLVDNLSALRQLGAVPSPRPQSHSEQVRQRASRPRQVSASVRRGRRWHGEVLCRSSSSTTSSLRSTT